MQRLRSHIQHSMTPLRTYRNRKARTRSNALSIFALVCYVISSGIVPAGFMAAPLDSGTAFHLCPGDARSAVIISKLLGGNEHHHHHAQAGGAEKTSADSGCAFSGVGNVIALGASASAFDAVPNQPVIVLQTTSFRYSYAWARPPVRSPPA